LRKLITAVEGHYPEFRPNPKRCGGDDAMIPLDARIPRPVIDGLDQ
jgi:hypothetical protein